MYMGRRIKSVILVSVLDFVFIYKKKNPLLHDAFLKRSISFV